MFKEFNGSNRPSLKMLNPAYAHSSSIVPAPVFEIGM